MSVVNYETPASTGTPQSVEAGLDPAAADSSTVAAERTQAPGEYDGEAESRESDREARIAFNRTKAGQRRTFWERIKGSPGVDECWIWTGTIDHQDYPLYWASDPTRPAGGRRVKAHRWAYEALRAEIPDGLQLDHLCRNRSCINPWHLDPVTSRVNSLRGNTVAARNAAKTHCPKGHAYSPENTASNSHGGRVCRTCRRERSRLRKREN